MNTASSIRSSFGRLLVALSLSVTSAYAQKVENCVGLSSGFGGSETTSLHTTRKIFSILPCDSKENRKIIDSLGDRLASHSDLGIYFLTRGAYLILELSQRKQGFIVDTRGENPHYIPFSNTGTDDISAILDLARETFEKNMSTADQINPSNPLRLRMSATMGKRN